VDWRTTQEREHWGAVVLRVLGGLLALALLQPWGRRLPGRLGRAVAFGGAGVLVLYGTA
jgi:hypothetical protein